VKWEGSRRKLWWGTVLNFPREIEEDQTNIITMKGNNSDNLFWDSRIRSRGTLFRI
jgi:hypothetical protein